MLRIILLASLLTLAAGCMTSEGYKDAVHTKYPLAADRLEKYDLDDDERVTVDRLRTVADPRDAVTYERARPAWEAAAPLYRDRIATDESLPAPLKREFLYTADGLDRLQDAEERYRESLGLVKP